MFHDFPLNQSIDTRESSKIIAISMVVRMASLK